MIKKLLIFLCLSLSFYTVNAQVPFAFRYQAAIRNTKNTPVNSELVFNINLFEDINADERIYSETHVILPDTNGVVAFSIGNGLTNDDFSSIVWAEGPYYIQVLIDSEEISFSQLVSVPYAMHAETASRLHNLQNPVLDNDPTTKEYVDNILTASKGYADSLAITPKDLDVSSSGDTLRIGGAALLIPGMSSDNMNKYDSQLLLGGSYNESLTTTLKTSDGNLIVMGTTESGDGDIIDFNGEVDIFISKVDTNLNKIWSKSIGGNAYDNGVVIIEEEDGYLIGATTDSNDGYIKENQGEFDILLVKLDFNGEMLWQETYGGAETEFVNAIIPNSHGGYYIGGSTFSTGGDVEWSYGQSDIWIISTDDDHEIINTVTIGGSKYETLFSLEQSGSNIIVYGSSSSNNADITQNNGALDFIKVELNENLEIIDQECFGSAKNEQLLTICSNDGCTLLGGNSFSGSWSANASKQYKNICLQAIGTNSWYLEIGGGNNDIIIQSTFLNDTLYLLGETSSYDEDINETKGAQDIWFISIDQDGKLINNKNLGGTYDETAKLMKSLANGEWLIAGESKSEDKDVDQNAGDKDIWIIHLDKNFNIKWTKSFGGSYVEEITNLHILKNNEIIICGTTSSNDYSITGLHDKEGVSKDIWLLKTTLDE